MSTSNSFDASHKALADETSLEDFEMTYKSEEKEYDIEGAVPSPIEPQAPERDLEKASSLPQPDESEAQSQVNVNDWNGPDDEENPYNWPTWLRVYHAVVPGLFGFAVTFGTSVYTPAVPDIMRKFDVSRTAALIGLTVYVLGLAAGPILSAPLSESHGRKIVYMISSPIFMLFTLGAGFSQSFASLVVCRWFAGLTGSPALAVGAGSNADLFPPKDRAVVTSAFLAAPFLGPSLGPIVGGFAAQYKGWRWTQWCMLFITLAVFALSIPTKETFKPIILKRRAKKHGITIAKVATGNSASAVKKSLLLNFVRPIHMLVTEPVVFFLSLYTAFAFAVLFLFFAAFPFVFSRPPYNFSTSQSGLTFISVGTGVIIAALTGILIDRVIYQKHHRNAIAAGKTHVPPERRLYNAMYGSFGIPVGLFWFAWTAGKGVTWPAAVVAAVPFAWGNLCIFTSSALYMVDVYGPKNGASAIAANGIFRYTLASVFPLFTVQMYEKMSIGWATSLLGFLSVLMLPIPFVFFRYGPSIRAKSRYPVALS